MRSRGKRENWLGLKKKKYRKNALLFFCFCFFRFFFYLVFFFLSFSSTEVPRLKSEEYSASRRLKKKKIKKRIKKTRSRFTSLSTFFFICHELFYLYINDFIFVLPGKQQQKKKETVSRKNKSQ